MINGIEGIPASAVEQLVYVPPVNLVNLTYDYDLAEWAQRFKQAGKPERDLNVGERIKYENNVYIVTEKAIQFGCDTALVIDYTCKCVSDSGILKFSLPFVGDSQQKSPDYQENPNPEEWLALLEE